MGTSANLYCGKPHPPQCAHWGTFPKGEGRKMPSVPKEQRAFLLFLIFGHFLQGVFAAEVCAALLVEAHELDPGHVA